ncbi:sulfide,quinone oxidoreductase flavo-binding [Lecanosticta acicola]|uniref:Sulfide,quinone oxidoreductase flavo-binding n=1 Tax=Lecanosticta acicola TaxID=111012 RepID=A0AAI8YX29_9PEZI|nr:sulfide,quinone oxidoreductase flavo-binding [Lecanosticta acicola]
MMKGTFRSLSKVSSPGRRVLRSNPQWTFRGYATASGAYPVTSSTQHHKTLVIGCGSAGLNVGHQLLRTGRFAPEEIAAVDPAEWHHYQPGWTLVGAGLKAKEDLRRPLKSLVDPKIKFYNHSVANISPEQNLVTLNSGHKLSYDHLVVVPGITLKLDAIKGLPEALANPDSNVSSTYSYETCSKVWDNITRFQKGDAIFTQPAGVVKCAGGPQKIMWLAEHKWRKAGIFNPDDLSNSPAKIAFATGLPVMFGVPKYSKRLDALREQRRVEGLFEHDLTSIQGNTATFTRPQGDTVSRHFDFLHAVPKMGPFDLIKNSPIANAAGFVDVDDGTTQHKKFPNVWSIGDASSLPTSKTAAAITAQAPVLVRNLLDTMDGKAISWKYDGYTSCPLLTEYGKVMLCEFKYGGQPQETFGNLLGIDQSQPRRAFYYLKKDFFPWVYYNSYVKGTWGGPKGWLRN